MIINHWLKGFVHSLLGAILCIAYLGDIIFFVKLITTTGIEAIQTFLYFIGCVIVTVFGPYCFNMVEEEDI